MHFIITTLILLMSCPVWGQSEECLLQADRMIGDAHWYMDEVYDLEDLQLEFDRQEVCRQYQLDNLVGFNTAFERALDAVFYNGDDAESPLRLFIDWVILHYGWDHEDYYDHELEELARRHLRDYVNRTTSALRLVGLAERAAQGESARFNWIFALRLPDFSDHSFWSIEDRRGEESTYIYGF